MKEPSSETPQGRAVATRADDIASSPPSPPSTDEAKRTSSTYRGHRSIAVEPGRKVAVSSAVIPSSTSGNKAEAEEEPVSAEREMSLSPVVMQAGLGGTGGGWSVMQNLRLARLTVDILNAHSQSAQVDADMTTSGPERTEDQLEEIRTNVDKVTLRTDSSGSGLLPIDAAVDGGGSCGASSTVGLPRGGR
ncbi:unnamed protein product [Tilletia controversa]|uniref:Uncharacterized protein n=2 Tax=Tilletia TaxID=13289 RepID=A0A9N8MCK3_9BASI|nr:unnamed protein product [Tilletia controversa]CAD6952782.1 unnamed protein product [Tilletia caries]CAD6961338.1 unnamed protein product [Tilletia laevis]CAD6916044.1 unnamed protein product [Tilletia controversa]CAD6963090.1 unnamed protein product [Tilletia controversa]